MSAQQRQFDYIGALWRSKWIILPLVALGIGGAVFVFSRMTPLYRATATLALIPQSISTSIYREPEPKIKQALLKRVTDEITGLSVLELVGEGLGWETKEPRILRGLAVGLQVFEADPETFLVQYVHENPEHTAVMANLFASSFSKMKKNEKLEEMVASEGFLRVEIARLEEELHSVNRRLADYQAAHKGELPSDREANRNQQAFLRARTAELDSRIDMETKNREQRLALLENPDTPETDLMAGTTLSRDPRQQQAEKLRRDLANARLRYTEKHPEVIRLNASLDRLLRSIEENPDVPLDLADDPGTGDDAATSLPAGADAETTLRNYLRLEITSIDDAIREMEVQRQQANREHEKLERQVQASYSREAEVEKLRGSINVVRSRLITNQDRLQQIEGQKEVIDSRMDDRWVLRGEAVVPLLPFQPNLLQILAAGVLAGGVLGMGIAFLREFLDRSVYTVEEIEELLGAEVLVVIPNMGRSGGHYGKKPGARQKKDAAHG